MLYLLNKELWYYIGYYLNGFEINNLLLINNQILSYFKENCFWEDYLGILINLKSYKIHVKTIENSKSIINAIQNFISNKLLFDLSYNISTISSIDRDSESPLNILKESRCYHFLNENKLSFPQYSPNQLGYLVQSRCCIDNTPCYWSSKPSLIDNQFQYSTMKVLSSLSFIYGFTLTPYQAFFQPDAPIYSPKEVCIQFLINNKQYINNDITTSNYIIEFKTMDELSNDVYYQTKYFPIEKLYQNQIFYLDYPILCLSSNIRLIFKGYTQRQTVENNDDYYMCISHFSLLGLPLINHIITREEKDEDEVNNDNNNNKKKQTMNIYMDENIRNLPIKNMKRNYSNISNSIAKNVKLVKDSNNNEPLFISKYYPDIFVDK